MSRGIAVHAGHVDVEQDQVRPVGQRQFDAQLRRVGGNQMDMLAHAHHLSN